MSARPDILWIITTQWRASATGYAGDPNAVTPCLDALAAQSVNFAQAVTPHPFGPFARASLLTGVHSPQNGVRDYFDPLPLKARTIAHDLNACGYTTAFFGKWHLARRDPAAALVGEAHARTIVPPAARGGFEHWEGFESGFLLNDPWLHGTRLETPQPFAGYQSDVVCSRAAEWLRELKAAPSSTPKVSTSTAAAAPWFATISLESPHPPYDAPAAGIAARPAAAIVLPANVPRGAEVEARARRELAGYYAHITATDRALGRLVAALDDEAVLRGRPAPVVVFTSVHGDMHGAHGYFRKGWPYEESVRVPLLVRETKPPGVRCGISSSALVSLVDLPAMTRAWAGHPNAQTPAAEPETDMRRISMPSVVALPHQCDRIWRGHRSAARKLILDERGEPWLFFDLKEDPLETRNLANDPAYRAEIQSGRARILAG